MRPQWLLILPYQIIILFNSLLESPYNIIYQKKKRKMKFSRNPLKVIKTVVRLMPRDLAMAALDTPTLPWINILVFPQVFLFPIPGKQRQAYLCELRPTLCAYWVSGQPGLPTKKPVSKKKKQQQTTKNKKPNKMGWKDSSKDKVTYCEIWWPEFDTWGPHVRRDLHTHAMVGMCSLIWAKEINKNFIFYFVFF